MPYDFSTPIAAPKPMCMSNLHEFHRTSSTYARLADESEAGMVLKIFVDHLVPIAHFACDIETIGHQLFAWIREKQVFVAVKNGEIVGCAAFSVGRPWYSKHEQMYEQGGVVVPKHRKGPAIARLIAALIEESKRRGVDLIFTANTTSQEGPRIMNKRYPRLGEIFLLRQR